MICGGKYKHHHYNLECPEKNRCKHYTFRVKKQTKPKSKTKDCEHFLERYTDTFIKRFQIMKKKKKREKQPKWKNDTFIMKAF